MSKAENRKCSACVRVGIDRSKTSSSSFFFFFFSFVFYLVLPHTVCRAMTVRWIVPKPRTDEIMFCILRRELESPFGSERPL